MAFPPSLPPSFPPAPMDSLPALPPQQAPPYSASLINLNQRYNMSANSLTEALLLLSGMYISLVKPDPYPVNIGLHAVFPRTSGTFLDAVTDPFTGNPMNVMRTYRNYPEIRSKFNISSSYTRSDYAPKELLDMLCEKVFPQNTITIFYLNNHLDLRQYRDPAVKYLPRIMESLGLPIISYDTQFSVNARPELSLQLAPTMGQMIDVVFAFLRKFGWTDFSFLCTLSYGCQDEIATIRTKVDESNRKPNVTVYGVEMFSYKLLSYINFTDGRDVGEVREKLQYEMDKDTRIIFVHGKGAEVKTILEEAKKLGITGAEYVWIFTSASISLSGENSKVADSYPLGSFIIGFDSSRQDMDEVVKTAVNVWLEALNSMASSEELDDIDFHTNFSCDRIKEGMEHAANGTKSPLYWKYGEKLYEYLLRSKLPGDLEFDEFGVLKANKFWIMNVQWEDDSVDSDRDEGRRSPGGSSSGRAGGFLTGRSPGRAPSYGLDRDRDSGSPFSFSRDRDSPFSRDRDTDRDSGSPFSRDRDPNRDRDSGSPFSRDTNSGSPFGNRNRDSGSPLSRDRDSGSPFGNRDRDSGSPLSRDRDSGSLFGNRDRDSGSPFANRDRDSGSPFANRNRDPGSPFSRDRDSPFSRNRDSGSPFSRNRDDGLPGSADPDSPPLSRARSAAFTSPESDKSETESGDSSPLTVPASSPSPADAVDKAPEAAALTDRSSDAASAPFKPSSESHSLLKEDAKRSSAIYDEEGYSRDDTDGKLSSRGFSGLPGRGKIRHGDRFRRRGGRGHHKDQDSKGGYDEFKALVYGNETSAMTGKELALRSRRDADRDQIAKKIADWNGHNLTMAGITWPGGASKPPTGKPEKYVLKVVTRMEDPHVIYTEMKNDTLEGEDLCDANSLPCKVYSRDKKLNRLSNETIDKCCTGLCIDLLKRVTEMLHFDVELTEAPDGHYGSPLNKNMTEWSGMLGELIHNEADMAIGALSITPERSIAVDFSHPFLQTGITIIVAIREGAISPTAFLEPYDYPSWSLILVFSVHATGASIFIFEWLSPYALDQGKTPLSVHKFSLFRSFWLIWAMLFGASVSTDQPRGCASRFLANIWALFAVVFCASYTANLAAFMITKDDYYDLSGIQDWRLKHPHHHQPPFTFATMANSSIDLNIEKNYPEIHRHMKNFAQNDVKEAIKSLKLGEIQAFIYDSTTLEYEVGKDVNCRLKTVGKRIAETGYGVAFPKKSQWLTKVNRALLRLQEDGDIERLQKFWLAGACHKKKETGVSSHRLGILNFTSAFILLGGGVILGVILLFMEHIYFRFGRKSLKKWDKCGCCSLVSLSMGQSLTFEQSVMEAIDFHKHHKCKDPLCETQMWKVKHELDIALLKISQLRKQIAHSASLEAARGHDLDSLKGDHDEPYQNGTAARRRRQQPSDAGGATGVDRSYNQPLLSSSGRHDTDDDETPVQSPKRTTVPSSSRASFPTAKNKVAAKEADIPLQNVRHSYPEKRSPSSNVRPASNGRPGSRTTPPRDHKSAGKSGKKTVAELDLHPPPPSFDEAMAGYSASPDDTPSSPSPPLPPPPSSPPPPASAMLTPHQSPLGGSGRFSDSMASNSLPSSDDKRHEPFILDSPDSPSSTFSDTSGKDQLPSPGTMSKLSDEGPSSTPDRDSTLASSPDIPTLPEDNTTLPQVGYAPGNQYNNAQTKYPMSSKGSERPTSTQGEIKPIKSESPVRSSVEDDNDVNMRRGRDKDGNVYVNVDDIIGKETSF